MTTTIYNYEEFREIFKNISLHRDFLTLIGMFNQSYAYHGMEIRIQATKQSYQNTSFACVEIYVYDSSAEFVNSSRYNFYDIKAHPLDFERTWQRFSSWLNKTVE